uniref:RING-type E3 ubiquitin transferase n=1 Tax=Caligus clemensi TaxID=344056 RepID=C1C051_CALCM|nr:RING finger protein C1orf166 [Caligus clemensi]
MTGTSWVWDTVIPPIGDFIPELLCLGVDGIICSCPYLSYRDKAKTLEELRNAPILKLNSHLKSEIESKGSLSEDGESIAVSYAFIRGLVEADKLPLDSIYRPELSGVLRVSTILEHSKTMAMSGFWLDDSKVVSQTLDSVPFSLKESLGHWGNARVCIEEPSRFSRIDTDMVYNKFMAHEGNLASYFFSWLSGNVSKGIQLTEEMLFPDQRMTAVGEVVLDKNSSKVFLRPPSSIAQYSPYILTKDSPQTLIEEFSSSTNTTKWALLLFGAAGIGIAAFGMYRYYKKWLLENQKEDELRQIRKSRAKHSASNPSNEDINPESACVICYTQRREVIILNCGHVSLCFDCGEEIKRLKLPCPICRSPISRITPMYLA